MTFRTADEYNAYEQLIRDWLDMSGHTYGDIILDEDRCRIEVMVSKHTKDEYVAGMQLDWAGDRTQKLRVMLHAEAVDFDCHPGSPDGDTLYVVYGEAAVAWAHTLLKGLHADVR